MVGIPKISGPQARERNVEHNPPVEHHREFTVPSGEPSSWGELRPSARVFKEMRERERDHSSACEEDSPRESGP
jgi:hypothetical protein